MTDSEFQQDWIAGVRQRQRRKAAFKDTIKLSVAALMLSALALAALAAGGVL